uniref:ATP synthase complex subunit 8 n=1 Tax=Pedetontus zhejiangensis TaxID=554671 RepID=A0A7L8EZC0_9INSE|nr:ATP synthase F0 subunit 8 [Pedetontus zhejiangensis]QOE17736.1 ATP synthase F0 subunit 8 [Pedetontus zhejiangensis]
MPQMAPLNWLMLFTVFFIIYMLFLILNYFNKFPTKTHKYELKPFKFVKLNWKW